MALLPRRRNRPTRRLTRQAWRANGPFGDSVAFAGTRGQNEPWHMAAARSLTGRLQARHRSLLQSNFGAPHKRQRTALQVQMPGSVRVSLDGNYG